MKRILFFENLKEVEINEEKELAVQNQLINIVQREVSQMKTIKWYASSILYSDKDEKNNPFHQSSMLGLSMLKPLQSLHRQEVEELGRILRFQIIFWTSSRFHSLDWQVK